MSGDACSPMIPSCWWLLYAGYTLLLIRHDPVLNLWGERKKRERKRRRETREEEEGERKIERSEWERNGWLVLISVYVTEVSFLFNNMHFRHCQTVHALQSPDEEYWTNWCRLSEAKWAWHLRRLYLDDLSETKWLHETLLSVHFKFACTFI